MPNLAMPKLAKLALLAATSSALFAFPAQAASPTTDAFVANVRPNVDLLDRSSRLALDQAGSGAIRAFARTEAAEQTIAANALVAWWQSNTARGADAALGRPVDGTPMDGVVVAPLDTASALTADVTTGVGDVLSGRSVAIDRPLTVTPAPRTPAPVLPAGGDDLDRLSAMKGRRFDAFYKTIQRDALRQLSTIYAAYIQNGDDPGLRSMAVRELPKINARLTELRRL